MVDIIIRERNNKNTKQLMLQIMNIKGEICNINLPYIEKVKINNLIDEVEIDKNSLMQHHYYMKADKVFINLDFADLTLYDIRISNEEDYYIIRCTKKWDKTFLEIIEDVLKPKCENCGEPLSHYKLYTEDGTFNPCSKCGHMNEKKYRKGE